MKKSILLNLLPLFIFLWMCLSFMACTSPTNNQTTTPTDNAQSEQVTSNDEQVDQAFLQPCYLATIGKDTAILQINKRNDTITGKLNYMFNQKDSNYGEIKGSIHNDTILVDYTFTSEGMISVREVTFIVRNGQITEGIGESVFSKTDNKMVFKNKTAIDYTGKSFIFSPVECSLLKE